MNFENKVNEYEMKILECKRALFAMLDQFGWTTEYKGNHCIGTCCESAAERAFSVLGLEDDPITMEKFYTEYDKVWTDWCHAKGMEPAWSYLEDYKNSPKTWNLVDDESEEQIYSNVSDDYNFEVGM